MYNTGDIIQKNGESDKLNKITDEERNKIFWSVYSSYEDTKNKIKNDSDITLIGRNEFGRFFRGIVLKKLANNFPMRIPKNEKGDHTFCVFRLESGEEFVYSKSENSYEPCYIDDYMLFSDEEIPRAITTARYTKLCIKGKRSLDELFLTFRNHKEVLIYDHLRDKLDKFKPLKKEKQEKNISFAFADEDVKKDVTMEAK